LAKLINGFGAAELRHYSLLIGSL